MKGSKYQPDKVDIAGHATPIAKAVQFAFLGSGKTPAAWDALADDERERLITVAIIDMRAMAMTARAEPRGFADAPGDEVAVDHGAPSVTAPKATT